MPSKPPYRILGVDPGTNVLGYAVVEVQGKNLQLLDLGVISMQHLPNQKEKLKKIFERLQVIIQHYHPRESAIEAPFFGKNVQSMLKLGRAQGVAMAAAMVNQVDVTEYSPKRIKQAVCGNGNASKEQVANMLEHLVNFKSDGQLLDATDALAAAVCHFFQSSSPLGKLGNHKDWGSFLRDNPDRVR